MVYAHRYQEDKDGGGGSHHLAFGLGGEREQVGKESLTIFKCQVIEGAASAAILFKVFVGGVPVQKRRESRTVN